jgi:MinD-like ATPase involved in chromosome partitioning or flagellar assembly
MGSVVTFYSYKGGVGRSMALANVAVLLAQQGVRVLAIDWDLEAPGLERYFQPFEIAPPVNGLLPMLVGALDGDSEEFANYTSTVDVGSGEPLTLLSSGREQEPVRYAKLLEDFDWVRFFRRGGGDFLEELRRQWKSEFDIVLIDSRTGLSDTGGVCTIQLPDVVVVMFTANSQSLLGARDVMRHVRKARQSLAYPRMQLTVFPLPARFGSRAEFRESQRWIERISQEFSEFYEDWLPAWADPREVLERVKIPQVDYFSFGEKLAVVEQGTSDPEGIGFVCDQVARVLRDDFRGAHDVLQLKSRLPEEQMKRARSAETAEDYDWDVYISHPHGAGLEIWVEEFVRRLEFNLRGLRGSASVFFERRELVLGADWPAALKEALARARVLVAILTQSYVESAWNVAEWETFADRERFSRSTRLIFPVLAHGGGNFPPEFTDRQSLDVRKFVKPGPAFWEKPEAFDLEVRIRELAEAIAAQLDEVPPFHANFPVVDPAHVATAAGSALPRL